MDFDGEFETHITVCLDELNSLEELKQWGIDHGLKYLHIVLGRGLTPSQPMLTRRGNGKLSNELATSINLSQSLKTAGFLVTRIKIEAAIVNNDIPQSSAESSGIESDRYFEHHIKLLLEPSADNTILANLAEKHSAHLSHNALRIQSDGCREWFVTQRCYSVGRNEARKQLNILLKAIAELNHTVLDVKEEYVVYDSNLAIDEGWIQSENRL